MTPPAAARTFLSVIAFLFAMVGLRSVLSAAEPPAGSRLELKVDGVLREALVFAPAEAKPAPVVFAFHGHGGTAGHASRTMAFQKLWPEAIIVYPQGLKTPGVITDPAG